MTTHREPHFTRFMWISPEEFDDVLSSFFSVTKITQGKTDIYSCVKR